MIVKNKIGLIILLILIVSIPISSVSAANNDNNDVLKIKRFNLDSLDHYYSMSFYIIPKNDIPCLSAAVKWYNDKNELLYSAGIWTTYNLKAGKRTLLYNITPSKYLKDRPHNLIIFIFDHNFAGDFSNPTLTLEAIV